MILSVANLKGGVGKTTLCYHLAYLFTRKNFRTLLIDIDPQGNLTSCYLSTPPDTSNHVSCKMTDYPKPYPIAVGAHFWPFFLTRHSFMEEKSSLRTGSIHHQNFVVSVDTKTQI
ncbi:MAG: ParA family protein [candidate division WOR-3 bacterium]